MTISSVPDRRPHVHDAAPVHLLRDTPAELWPLVPHQVRGSWGCHAVLALFRRVTSRRYWAADGRK